MSVKNRLKEFIAYTGLTVSAWEKSINVSNGYVNGMVKGIGEDKIRTILEVYPNLNFDWLMTGRGQMIIETEKKYESEDLNRSIANEENPKIKGESAIMIFVSAPFDKLKNELPEFMSIIKKEAEKRGLKVH